MSSFFRNVLDFHSFSEQLNLLGCMKCSFPSSAREQWPFKNIIILNVFDSANSSTMYVYQKYLLVRLFPYKSLSKLNTEGANIDIKNQASFSFFILQLPVLIPFHFKNKNPE